MNETQSLIIGHKISNDSLVNILLIEDNAGDTLLIQEMIAEAGYQKYNLTCTEYLAEGIRLIEESYFDIIFLDLSLPDSFGIESFTAINNKFPEIPVVIISGRSDKDFAIQAVGTGAQDFIVKGDLDTKILERSIHYSIQRKQSELMLKESEKQIRNIINSNADGMLIVNMEGKILFSNPAARSMLSKNNSDLLGESFDLSYLENTNKELKINKIDGSFIIVEINFDELIWQGEKTFLISLRDITERKEAEEKIRSYNEKLSEINASKDKFFSIFAHDLKNPFNSLLGYSDMLITDWNDFNDAEKFECVNNIKDISKNIFNLLENLLAWSRIQINRMEHYPENINLRDLTENTIALLNSTREESKINLTNEILDGTTVYADVNMVNTIVRNLLSNALKFTQKDGNVNIKANTFHDHIEIHITDSGIGISESDIEKLFKFDVHHSTSSPDGIVGSGLGLIICKELIEKNGGEIRVESTQGKGSTFKFTLPTN